MRGSRGYRSRVADRVRVTKSAAESDWFRARGEGAGSPAPSKKDEDEPGFFGRLSRSIFGSKKGEIVAKGLSPSLNSTFINMRDALARFAVSNNGVPDTTLIYDWKSLRRLVEQYGKIALPATEAEAGFTFVKYKPESNREGYILLVDLNEPQEGVKRVEIHPYGVDRVN